MFLFVLLAPIFLGMKKVSEFIAEHRKSLVMVTVLTLATFFQPDVFIRSVALVIAMLVLELVIFHWFTLEVNQKGEKTLSFLVGLSLFILVRIVGRSLNLALRTNWGLVITILVTMLLSISHLIERSRMPVNESSEHVDLSGKDVTRQEIETLLNVEEKLPPFEPQKGDEWPFIAIALGGLFFLTHWLFTSHGVIARWAGLESFPFGMLVLSAFLSGVFIMYFPFTKTGTWWLLGLVGGMMLAYGGYINSLIGGMLLALTMPAFWFIVIYKIQSRHVGRIAAVSVLVYLFLTLGSVFTVTFAYVPGGEIFREQEEMLLLISLVMLSFSLIPEMSVVPTFDVKLPPVRQLNVLIFLVIFGLTGAAGIRASVDALTPSVNPSELVIMTWNIQQGFDVEGHVNVQEVARIIKDTGVGIIGLQESDTVRVSSGNRDVVEWLAAELGMYSYYGPTPKDSTFGNALLSVYPIKEARFVILPSKGELAVLLVTKILIGDVTVNVLVAHFGETEEDRTAQANATIKIIKELQGPIFLIGDFNSEPESTQIQTILSAGLSDAYFVTNGKHVTTLVSSEKTIDFIFHANVTVTDAVVLNTGIISDHKPVAVTFEL